MYCHCCQKLSISKKHSPITAFNNIFTGPILFMPNDHHTLQLASNVQLTFIQLDTSSYISQATFALEKGAQFSELMQLWVKKGKLIFSENQ